MQAYEKLIEILNVIDDCIESRNIDMLSKLKLYVQELKKYKVDEGKINAMIEEIEKCEKKSWITRSRYFEKEGATRLYLLGKDILKTGCEKARQMKPELEPTERALLLQNIYKFAYTKGKIKAIVEIKDKEWEKEIKPFVEEMMENLKKITTICPWIRFTQDFFEYNVHTKAYRYVPSKEGIIWIIETAGRVVEGLMKEYKMGEEEIKVFANFELEGETRERERMSKELEKLTKQVTNLKEELKREKETIKELEKIVKKKEKENLKLSSQLKELEKKLEKAKMGKLPINVRAEIEEKDKKIGELTQLLKTSEQQILSLRNELKEKEREIEELRKKEEVKFHPRLREEDLDLLDKTMAKFMLSASDSVATIKANLDELFSIVDRIHAYRSEGGEVNEIDQDFLKALSQFSNSLKEQSPSQQLNENSRYWFMQLCAQFIIWRRHIETQRKIEERLSHL
jgi:HAMP domain-containing protein